MPRLFAAIELPSAHCEAVLAQHRDLESARWEGHPHITLTHFGNIEPSQIDELGALLDGVAFAPFEVRTSNIGFFGSDVMWIGVEHSPALTSLARDLAVVRAAVAKSPERHGFSPHVTLARLTGPDERELARYVSDFDHARLVPFVVAKFTLFESDGDRYARVAAFGQTTMPDGSGEGATA